MLERMNEIEGTIEPQLGDRKIWIDKEERIPKFKKNGEYTSAVSYTHLTLPTIYSV